MTSRELIYQPTTPLSQPTPNVPRLSERHPHPTFQPPPGPVLQIFRFAPFGNTKFARMLCITISLLAAFHSRRSHRLVLVVYVRLKKSNCVGLIVLFSNAWKTRTEKCITSFQSHRPGNLLGILLFFLHAERILGGSGALCTRSRTTVFLSGSGPRGR